MSSPHASPSVLGQPALAGRTVAQAAGRSPGNRNAHQGRQWGQLRHAFCCGGAFAVAVATLGACDHRTVVSGSERGSDAGLPPADGAAPAFPWAVPGQVRWLIDYKEVNRAQVKLMLDAQINLIQGVHDPEALQLIKDTPDAHAMQYICSRTIYHEQLFPKHPELRDAAIRNADQTYRVIYFNDKRYAGCWNQPAWVDYLKGRMDQLEQSGVEAVFFDNPMTWECHCPRCQQLYTEFAKEKTGQELQLAEHPAQHQHVELQRWFTIETAERFWKELHAYARRKHLFIVANNLTYHLVAQGLVDGVFGEASAHPPFQMDVAAYKLGLAASGGKPTGILNYLPTAVMKKRGNEVPNTSTEQGTMWEGAPIAEEFELGYATGLALGGNFIVNTQLNLGRRIEELTDPEDARIWAALRKYGDFAKAHPEFYGEAQRGATVAALFSLTKGPREGELLGMNRANINSLLAALNAHGIAGEVIVETDLTPARWAGLKAVVVDDISSLEPSAVTGLRNFAEAGGMVVFAKPGMVRERYAALTQARSVGAFFPELATAVNSYAFKADEGALDGYEPEPIGVLPRVKVTTVGVKHPVGKATFTFAGVAGSYRLTVSYFDEHDGQGRFELLVDGRLVGKWDNDQDNDKSLDYVSPAVRLQAGAKIVVVGYPGGGEFARFDGLRVDTDLGSTLAAKTPIGKGWVWQVGASLAQLTAAEETAAAAVWAALRDLEPLTPVGAWPNTLLLNLTRARPGGALLAHLVNSDFRYDADYALQRIEPAGPVTLNVGQARSARLLTPDGAIQPLAIKDGRVQVPAVRVYTVVVVE
ncbi:MAG: hypothetical protein IPL40_09160 [Proteobacteria bacterium]|nr:hypothetical protein [Pseudomonadota bacterium]